MESFTCPLTGTRLRAKLLGGCMFGKLAVRAHNGSGRELLWYGRDPDKALTAGLRSRCNPRRLVKGVFHLCYLEEGRYHLENRIHGVELFQVLEALPSPEPKPTPPPAPWPVFGVSINTPPTPPPPARKIMILKRPTA